MAEKPGASMVRFDPTAEPLNIRVYRQGETLFRAGSPGQPWRVVVGTVRLDRGDASEATFAGLALAGDVIGAETLLFDRYTFTARALVEVTVEPWLNASTTSTEAALLSALAMREQRAADVVALRCGEALERVTTLLQLLSGPAPAGHAVRPIKIPELRDIAEITNLAIATVSRSLKRLRQEGRVQRQGWRYSVFAQNHFEKQSL